MRYFGVPYLMNEQSRNMPTLLAYAWRLLAQEDVLQRHFDALWSQSSAFTGRQCTSWPALASMYRLQATWGSHYFGVWGIGFSIEGRLDRIPV